MTPFTFLDARRGASVASARRRLPDARAVGVGIGIGRVAIGTVLLAAPAAVTRLLGVDSATAKRATFIARMLAVRDAGLGAGTIDALPDGAAPWLLVGAVSDAVDAVVIAGALRSGVARGPAARLFVLGAAATAGMGALAAVELRD